MTAADRSLVDELASALLVVEWTDGDDGDPYCRVCNRRKPHGHKEHCAIDVALRRAGVR